MLCPICQNETRKFGKNRNGSQRYRCDKCAKTFTDEGTRPDDRRFVEKEKMILALRMLLEGNSIRAVERLLGIHRDTIISAMVASGEQCKKFLESTIQNVPCHDVECDEIWGFVAMKEKTRVRNTKSECFGDAWCFTAVERNTKLILAWHVGKRTPTDTFDFAEKLKRATVGHFQLTTDGFKPYLQAIRWTFGATIDYATLIKVYANSRQDARYSPGEVSGTITAPWIGAPDEDRICTSHVERSNLTLRMQIRRLTRLTNAYSKKWENHEAAMAFFFAYYNFCRVHGSLKATPAKAAGLTTETWNLERLLQEANKV